MNLNNSYKALIESYTAYLQTLGFARTTLYNYPRYVSDFLTYLAQKGVCNIRLLTSKMVFDYFAYLERKRGKRTKQAYGSSYLKHGFAAVDKFLGFLHHAGAQNTPPPTGYRIESVRKKPLRILTPEEIKTLYDTLPLTYPQLCLARREPRQMAIKLVLDLCYGCALRRSEALKVKVNDVNFDQRVIHVKQGKNYKDRFVPMSREVYQSLQSYVYQYHRYFNEATLTQQARRGYLYPFGGQSIAHAVKWLVKYSNSPSLKAKKPSPHTLRHSIATHLLQNGMDIAHIARFLGHSSLKSTQLYTHIINEYQENK